LRQRFELRAAAMNTDALAIRRAVMDFIMPRGEYLAYDEVFRYANEIYKAVAAIDDLIRGGGVADAIVIAREAIGWLSGLATSTTRRARWPAPLTNYWRSICVPARPRRPNPFRSATIWPDYCWTTAVNFIPIWTTTRNF
jgi:hypothetical protein